MLPQAPAIPTAWLSPEANSGGQRNAAFLVVNDKSNDAAKDDVDHQFDHRTDLGVLRGQRA